MDTNLGNGWIWQHQLWREKAMNPGQRVMVIASWYESECIPPRIGSLGVIAEAMDIDGDYYVLVDDYPCPVDSEPEWYIPSWALVPIDLHSPSIHAIDSVSKPVRI